MYRTLQYVFIGLFFALLLSTEKVIGLPLWFCVFWASWVQSRTTSSQIYWVLGLGFLLAVLYALPVAVGMMILAGLVGWLHITQKIIKQEVLRLVLGSEIAVVFISVMTHVVWTPEKLIAHLCKLVVTWVLISLILGRRAQQGLGITSQLRKKYAAK